MIMFRKETQALGEGLLGHRPCRFSICPGGMTERQYAVEHNRCKGAAIPPAMILSQNAAMVRAGFQLCPQECGHESLPSAITTPANRSRMIFRSFRSKYPNTQLAPTRTSTSSPSANHCAAV